MKVGYLGPRGTFSHEICKVCYNQSVEKIPYRTIKETIVALNDGEVDEVIVPVENSLQGCVTETLDTLIASSDVSVKQEQVLKIYQILGYVQFVEKEKICFKHIIKQ